MSTDKKQTPFRTCVRPNSGQRDSHDNQTYLNGMEASKIKTILMVNKQNDAYAAESKQRGEINLIKEWITQGNMLLPYASARKWWMRSLRK